jgi:hypothetical protein
MFRRILAPALCLALLCALTLSSAAQDDVGPEVVLEGLNSPRHLTIDGDGTLYVAEAGIGGDSTGMNEGGTEVVAGLSAQVTTLTADGERNVLLEGLMSIEGFGGFLGVNKVMVMEDEYWVLYGEGLATDELAAFDSPFVSALVFYDRASFEAMRVVDVLGAEKSMNPDGDEFTLSSNPVDFAVGPDGTVYIVDASANTVWQWTEDDGVSVYITFQVTGESSDVPSTIEVGPDGDIYVGFLGGFPFIRDIGLSRIEHYAPDGELLTRYQGVNLVTDLYLAEDGTLYAVELADGIGASGFLANTGRIVTVDAGGVTPVVEGLNYPYGMTMDADGRMLVGVNSAFVEAGAGMVIVVEAGMVMGDPAAPAATEEAEG